MTENLHRMFLVARSENKREMGQTSMATAEGQIYVLSLKLTVDFKNQRSMSFMTDESSNTTSSFIHKSVQTSYL